MPAATHCLPRGADQGRDFVLQLDAFDDAQATRERLAGLKIDLFDVQPGVPPCCSNCRPAFATWSPCNARLPRLQ
ncbi:hypothetical protein ACSFA8_25725 [Variovorax sp. RT4R15]|uniref:hypothetical protein n=1 Tax=Variovorax sp. RT4R15 TaxID=3443737 RepID=UPI003F48EA66